MTAATATQFRRARVSVAVIGVGRWGSQLVRVFSGLERAAVVAACDLEASRLSGLDPSIDRARWESVLERRDVDAVVIATPPHCHAELTLAALARGKHVFVEKPMAMTLPDALRIRAAALASGRRVMVGLVLHYHPAVTRLAELVEVGALGTIRHLNAARGGGRRPAAEHPAWWSLAPHDISLAQSLFRQTATSVIAERANAGELVTARIGFGDREHASLRLDAGSRTRSRRVVVVGTRATAVFDDLEPTEKLRLFESGVRLLDVPALSAAEPLALEAEHFVGSLIEGTPFRTDIDHAVDVVAVLASGQHSMLAGGAPIGIVDWRPAAAE
jgi:predicted dehydrogenase